MVCIEACFNNETTNLAKKALTYAERVISNVWPEQFRGMTAMLALVTGGSGFLGRRVAEILIQRGEMVRLLVRSSSQLGSWSEGTCEIERCDFDLPNAAHCYRLKKAFEGVDVVFHCAGHSADWGAWDDFYRGNVLAVSNLLTAARAYASVLRFVHVSTTDVYGYQKIPPDESGPLCDVGLPYNSSKLLGDQLALGFGQRTGLPVTVVRPGTIFGPRSQNWVLEVCRLLVRRRVVLIDGGRTSAGLVYVDDVVNAMIRLAETPSALGYAFNIGDPKPVSWRSYFDLMAEIVDAPRPWLNLNSRMGYSIATLHELAYRWLGQRERPLFTRHVVLVLSRNQSHPIDRLKRSIGSFPIIGFDEGLAETTNWIRRQHLAGR